MSISIPAPVITSRLSHSWRTLLCLLAGVVACSCATPDQAPAVRIEQGASVAAADAPAPMGPPAERAVEPTSPHEPLMRTLTDYKVAAARRIAQINPQHLYEGAPPPMLKSVVVLTIVVDEEGRPARVRVLRGNGHRALEQLALQSVQQSAPLPRPGLLARRGVMEFSETWLFREDGRFQLRSMAEAQADS